MKKRASGRRKKSSYDTIVTIISTLLVVAIVWVISLAWSTLGRHSISVSYTAGTTDFIGAVPSTRKFEPGEEVVVRAGDISKSGTKFLGWKDVNGVIGYAEDILVNGAVFKMPEADVVLEAVWEGENAIPANSEAVTENTPADASSEAPADTSDTTVIYKINSGTDSINVRDKHGYDSKVIAKISDSSVKIEYSGKYEELYEEESDKTYDWYYVEIPSKNVSGWIRSDLITRADNQAGSETTSSKASASSDDDSGEKYLKSDKYDVALMYAEADDDSDIVEKIEDDEIILYFNNESEEITDEDGDKTTWYHVKNSSSGKTGWIDAKRLQEAE